MLSPASTIRRRKIRKLHGRTLPLVGKILVGFWTFLGFVFFVGLFLLGLMYTSLLKDLPPVGNIEILYRQTENGFLEPIRVYDRDGTILFELVHPLATNQRWVEVSGSGTDVLPRPIIDAAVVSQDESYWVNRGYDLRPLLFALLRGDWRTSGDELPRTITQRLVAMTILPAEDLFSSPLRRYFREAIMAQRLTERYSKEQILEWYLNTAGFGPLISGIDGASLVYFRKHSNELSLAEGVTLLGLSQDNSQAPRTEMDTGVERKTQLLKTMHEKGMISEFQYRSSLSEVITPDHQRPSREANLQSYVWENIHDLLGSQFLQRGNLQVFTSINGSLQVQVGCVIQTASNQQEIQSLDLESMGSDIVECSSSSNLQGIKQGEVSTEHSPYDLASIILDPANGEILSFHGAVDLPVPSGSMLYPFVYLTAFSKGSSPGTMVMDIPSGEGEGVQGFLWNGYEAKGPVRIRTALIGGYPYAAHRTFLTMGRDAIYRVFRQMGVFDLDSEFTSISGAVMPEALDISLLNAAFGYGVFAHEGKMVGVRPVARQNELSNRELTPLLIKRIQEQSGKVLYEATKSERPILSNALAYLVTHVLSDDAERWSVFGLNEGLEIGFPFAVMMDQDLHDNTSWTIGYTASRVVGVWMRDESREDVEEVAVTVDSTPLWAVIMENDISNLQLEGWKVPSEIVSVEVCDPSGLLPTSDCPRVVTEVFIKGTEPVYYDHLYQPVRMNKDTGKLATAMTPLDKVEEFVFMLLPPEARDWAQAKGIMGPTLEYDTLQDLPYENRAVGIDSPREFAYLTGKNWISGWMDVEDFSFYRLQYGQGLNPTHWYQIGEDHLEPVEHGVLTLWDTSALEGLYTLQLIVVDNDGIAQIATRFVTVDRSKPEIEVLTPQEGQEFSQSADRTIQFEVSVTDNIGISRVEMYLDGKKIGTIFDEPFRIQIPLSRSGTIRLNAKTVDFAGNVSQSEIVTLKILE